jgi:dipeptidyl aminopeptidase/acylaminoacyl peptidase
VPVPRAVVAVAVAALAAVAGGCRAKTIVGTPAVVVDASYDGPRCDVAPDVVMCRPRVSAVAGRRVYWQTPTSPPPPAGYPVALVFQGSWVGPDNTWLVERSMPFGGYFQALLQARLLERGYVVIAPEAEAGVAWQTNSPRAFERTRDYVFMAALLDAIRFGEFGPSDPARLYATGISSGGYMTSRMAISFPGRFRALAIQSASYARCYGPLCSVPALPPDHPPTLLLHGADDRVVPVATMWRYANALSAAGLESDVIVDEGVGHAWLPEAPDRVVAWFESHGGAPAR